MYTGHFQDRIILGVIVGAVYLFYLIAEWLDRRTEPPIMRQRINEGSDEYFATRKSLLEAADDSTRDAFRPNVGDD